MRPATLTHHGAHQVARRYMEEYVVQSRLSNRIKNLSQTPACIHSARLIPIKTHPTLPPSLTPPQSHPQVNIPLILIPNPSTPSKNRLLFPEINLCPLYVPPPNPI